MKRFAATLLNLITRYLASHKGTIVSMAAVPATAFFGVLTVEAQAHQHMDIHAALSAGGVVTMSAIFGTLSGYGKSPSTPKQDPPVPSPDPNDTPAG